MVRFEVGDLLRMPVPPRPRTTSCSAATPSSTSPRRSATRCTRGSSTPLAPGGYLVVGASERVADPRGLGLTSPFPFIYRKG